MTLSDNEHNPTNLRTRWDGVGSICFSLHLWPLEYHRVDSAADSRISTSILQESKERESLETPCRRFGFWHEWWFHAYKGTMLQMPYFTKQLAAETKQFRLHYEHLSDGNMKRKKLLRPESDYRLWSSDGFIIQQTVSVNMQALRSSGGAFSSNHYSMAEVHVFY